MSLGPHMSAPYCNGVLQDEAVLGCLSHRPSTALGMARFLRQPIGEVLLRLRRLTSLGVVVRTEEGLYSLKKSGDTL